MELPKSQSQGWGNSSRIRRLIRLPHGGVTLARSGIVRGLVGAVGLLLVAGTAFAGDPTTGGGSPVLRVGVTPISPPMIFKEGKKVVGIEADLALALGRDLGREVQFVEVPWEDLLDALNDGKIDIIMSSMSVTRARQFRAAFCDPYLRISLMALVRAGDEFRYGPLATSMTKRPIGVKKATTGDLLVQLEFPKAKRKFYKSGDEAAKALSKKDIDLFIDDSPMIWYLAGVYEAQGLLVSPMVLSEQVLAWAVNRSDTPLQEAANAFLKKFQASGEFDRLMHRWIPKFQ